MLMDIRTGAIRRVLENAKDVGQNLTALLLLALMALVAGFVILLWNV